MGVRRYVDDVRREIQRHGVMATFVLTGGGETFSIRVAPRYRTQDNLTAGQEQQLASLSIAAGDWVHRAPRKHDAVTIDGRKYAISDGHRVMFADTEVGYRVNIEG